MAMNKGWKLWAHYPVRSNGDGMSIYIKEGDTMTREDIVRIIEQVELLQKWAERDAEIAAQKNKPLDLKTVMHEVVEIERNRFGIRPFDDSK